MKVFEDEIKVEMVSALGCPMGTMIMPRVMRDGLVELYFKSKAVERITLYIDGKEITDGINHNPYNVDLKVGEKIGKAERKE